MEELSAVLLVILWHHVPDMNQLDQIGLYLTNANS